MAEVAAYYRSKPVRGVWRIEPVAAAQAVFQVSHQHDPRRIFATITISPAEVSHFRAQIEIALHDLHKWTEVPAGVFD